MINYETNLLVCWIYLPYLKVKAGAPTNVELLYDLLSREGILVWWKLPILSLSPCALSFQCNNAPRAEAHSHSFYSIQVSQIQHSLIPFLRDTILGSSSIYVCIYVRGYYFGIMFLANSMLTYYCLLQFPPPEQRNSNVVNGKLLRLIFRLTCRLIFTLSFNFRVSVISHFLQQITIKNRESYIVKELLITIFYFQKIHKYLEKCKAVFKKYISNGITKIKQVWTFYGLVIPLIQFITVWIHDPLEENL